MGSGMDLLIKGAQQIGINLGEAEQEKFRLYAELIEDWSKKINLVSYQSEEELYRSHFLDSLFCGSGYEFQKAEKVIDLGSGAGFPAIPLKICFPNLQFWLVESRNKRCGFLQRVIEELNLDDCFVVWDRIEKIAHQKEHREIFDCAVARAVAPLSVLLELGLPFLRRKGVLIALKGHAVIEEIKTAGRALEILGGAVDQVIPYYFPGEKGRNVVVVSKERETPLRFPRKPGIPAKKPL
jgi:16S rRNA (guanine527-N7)-methyltransferase